MSSGFSPKVGTLQWSQINSVDVDSLISGEKENDLLLESLYPMIVKASINFNDPQLNSENFGKLFKISQMIMELKTIYNEEDLLKIKELKQKLDLVSQGGRRHDNKLEELLQNANQLEQKNQFLIRNLQTAEQTVEREKKANRELKKA